MRSIGVPSILLAAIVLLGACGAEETARVPLDPASPWPKFRRDARQTGRSDVRPQLTGGALWEFPTGKGIFSTPVIGGDGTVYVGSADRTFYAIAADGTLRWSFPTGGVIDSSALLDDTGRLYVGSGDGHLYALDAATGEEIWDFAADPPETNDALINWFEGNVAIGPDGTLYAGNDNFFLYALDRDGSVAWRVTMPDQTWSLPAVDPETGALFVGNNSMLPALGANVFAFDANGSARWEQRYWNGTVAASPLLTREGRVVVGGFDGYVRAFTADRGELVWEVGTRDHIYASPAELPDGTIVQPSADGTIYALDPDSGAQRWAFDTLEPVRSSPAVDGDGNVYVGSGEGRLFVLNPDGTLRWSLRLIQDERNDLNASPALGRDAIIIAGESGRIFSVPYDYCLRPAAETDDRCAIGPGEDLPADGVFLWYTTALGAPLMDPPAAIDPNRPLVLTLFVRAGGDTVLAHIDSASVQVTVEPAAEVRTEVSSDRRFLVVTPLTRWAGAAGGPLSVRVSGQYLVDPERDGLSFSGGVPGGTFDETFSFTLSEAPAAVFTPTVPAAPGDPASVWELYRIAAPLPSLLPSYNQIGFDSLHYLVGLVEGSGEHLVAWVVGAKLADGADETVVDPATRGLFALEVESGDGLLTMVNEAGFSMEAMGAEISFTEFRLSARLGADGMPTATPSLVVASLCSHISIYGPFLGMLGLCNPETDLLLVSGAALLRPHGDGVQQAPPGVGTVTFEAAAGAITARLAGSSLRLDEHSVGLLLVDAATGRPLSLDYGLKTIRQTAGDGTLESVALEVPDDAPTEVRAYLMVDTYPAARGELTLP